MGRLKPNSMFSRLMVLFTLLIMISMLFMSVVFTTSIRSQQINDRLTQIQAQAMETGELVKKRYEYQLKGGSSMMLFNPEAVIGVRIMDRAIRTKVGMIAKEYSAYVMVTQGEYITNFSYMENEESEQKSKIDSDTFQNIIPRVNRGETVATKLKMVDGSPGMMFVVGVPWGQEEGKVEGTIVIHTSAQVLEASYKPLLTRVLGIMMITFLLAMVFAYIFTKEMTKPLNSMAKATTAMARGDFNQKAEEEGAEEIIQLAKSFNSMSSQLEQLENSRREFVANVSHELRSPITSIHGFVQGMQDGTIPLQEHPKYLQIVSEETTRLSKLINELLQLSRIEQGHTTMKEKTFDINELVRRVLLRRYNDIEQKQIEMSVHFEQENCQVMGDADAIEQVMVNLMDNAIKFTPDNGTIWLGTKEEQHHILVWVEDDGQDIDQEDLVRIFERFYKVDKAHTSGKGTGLGLSISKRIMDEQEQKIWATSGGGKPDFTLHWKKEKRQRRPKQVEKKSSEKA
ncbi:MAG: cell wall metabolism sensor histidine kinase WalK [Clostridiales bacterium]|nr:cell wall metabolism sensor histidine kinase WalK [Clostridiales bacterium]